jgi:glycerol-3-phosphate dehydrogenase subunit C
LARRAVVAGGTLARVPPGKYRFADAGISAVRSDRAALHRGTQTMREGSLESPVRHPIPWEDADFYDADRIDAELRRVFDICHGCRRCFNLCDSFPRLFDLVDQSPSGELDSVKSADFKPVVDACTLCDMCFMTKCPYVPPHAFDLDFPHLMLRYRAAELRRGEVRRLHRELTETDRNGKLAALAAPLANWASSVENGLSRPLMEKVAGIDRHAALPKFHGKTLVLRAMEDRPDVDRTAPAFGRKAVLYATCFANYNGPSIGLAARAVLAKNGVATEVIYPACCGMPQLEQGDLARVAEHARRVSAELAPWIDEGFDIVALVPSCALMLKFEWPLVLPQDAAVKRLAEATFDITEYVVDIAKREGLAPGLRALDGGVALHIACHARAQNMGQKAAEMLRLIPGADLAVIERCSGHGGSWGVMQGNFDTALKVGRPVARQAAEAGKSFIASECPLAATHIVQGMERLDEGRAPPALHPIELFARAYGL